MNRLPTVLIRSLLGYFKPRELAVWPEVCKWSDPVRERLEKCWQEAYGRLADHWLGRVDRDWVPTDERLDVPIGMPQSTRLRNAGMFVLGIKNDFSNPEASLLMIAKRCISWRDRFTILSLIVIVLREDYARWRDKLVPSQLSQDGKDLGLRLVPEDEERIKRQQRAYYEEDAKTCLEKRGSEGYLSDCPPDGFRSRSRNALGTLLQILIATVPTPHDQAAFFVEKLLRPLLLGSWKNKWDQTPWLLSLKKIYRWLPMCFVNQEPFPAYVCQILTRMTDGLWADESNPMGIDDHRGKYLRSVLATHGNHDAILAIFNRPRMLRRAIRNINMRALSAGMAIVLRNPARTAEFEARIRPVYPDPDIAFDSVHKCVGEADAMILCGAGNALSPVMLDAMRFALSTNADDSECTRIIRMWVPRLKVGLSVSEESPDRTHPRDNDGDLDEDEDEEKDNSKDISVHSGTNPSDSKESLTSAQQPFGSAQQPFGSAQQPSGSATGRHSRRANEFRGWIENGALDWFELMGVLVRQAPEKTRQRVEVVAHQCLQQLLLSASVSHPVESIANLARSSRLLDTAVGCRAAYALLCLRREPAIAEAWEPAGLDASLREHGWRVHLPRAPELRPGSVGRLTMLGCRPPHLRSDVRWLLEWRFEASLALSMGGLGSRMRQQGELMRSALQKAFQNVAAERLRTHGELWHVLYDSCPGAFTQTGFSNFGRFYVRIRDEGDKVRTRLMQRAKEHVKTKQNQIASRPAPTSGPLGFRVGEELYWSELSILRDDRPEAPAADSKLGTEVVDSSELRRRLIKGGRRRLLLALIVDASNYGPCVHIRNERTARLEDDFWNQEEWQCCESWSTGHRTNPADDAKNDARLPRESDARHIVTNLLQTLGASDAKMNGASDTVCIVSTDAAKSHAYGLSCGGSEPWRGLRIDRDVLFESAYGDFAFEK